MYSTLPVSVVKQFERCACKLCVQWRDISSFCVGCGGLSGIVVNAFKVSQPLPGELVERVVTQHRRIFIHVVSPALGQALSPGHICCFLSVCLSWFVLCKGQNSPHYCGSWSGVAVLRHQVVGRWRWRWRTVKLTYVPQAALSFPGRICADAYPRKREK